MSNKPNTITVGQLRQDLARYPDDTELYFGIGDLRYYRTKDRGVNLVQIEFDEIYTIHPGCQDDT